MRALICGAGLAGLALARSLANRGWEVVLLDHAAALRDEGYMLDFFGPGLAAATELGLLPRLRAHAYRFGQLNYVDRNGKRTARLDYVRLAEAAGGMLNLLRGDLQDVLAEGLDARVDLRFGRTVTAVDQAPGHVAVSLSDGTQENADLLVGADGIHSKVRRLVFGADDEFLRFLGMHVSSYIFRDPEISAQLGEDFVFTDTPGRMLGLYRLRGDRVAVLAAHRTADPTLPVDLQQHLLTVYKGLGWLTSDALRHCPRTPYYDQVAQVEMPRWHQGRVVLLGDACQAVSLLAGQGASLAIAAAWRLAAELDTATSIPAALEAYETRCRPIAREKQRTGRETAQWFLPATRARVYLRRAALRTPGLNRVSTSALVGGGSP